MSQKKAVLERDWGKDTIIFSTSTGEPVAVGHPVGFWERWRTLSVQPRTSQKTLKLPEETPSRNRFEHTLYPFKNLYLFVF